MVFEPFLGTPPESGLESQESQADEPQEKDQPAQEREVDDEVDVLPRIEEET